MEIKTYYQSFYLKKIPIACLVEKVLDVSQTHLFGFIYVSAFLYRHNKTHNTNEEQEREQSSARVIPLKGMIKPSGSPFIKTRTMLKYACSGNTLHYYLYSFVHILSQKQNIFISDGCYSNYGHHITCHDTHMLCHMGR